jgi:hypothetical protein
MNVSHVYVSPILASLPIVPGVTFLKMGLQSMTLRIWSTSAMSVSPFFLYSDFLGHGERLARARFFQRSGKKHARPFRSRILRARAGDGLDSRPVAARLHPAA